MPPVRRSLTGAQRRSRHFRSASRRRRSPSGVVAPPTRVFGGRSASRSRRLAASRFGAGALSCRRSFGSPFSRFFFFFVVSPFRPSGAACVCCGSFSSAVIAPALQPPSLAPCLPSPPSCAASLGLPRDRCSASSTAAQLGASGSSFEVDSALVVTVHRRPARSPHGAADAAGVAPHPDHRPQRSSGPAGKEFRGACPNRIFSRLIFFVFALRDVVRDIAPSFAGRSRRRSQSTPPVGPALLPSPSSAWRSRVRPLPSLPTDSPTPLSSVHASSSSLGGGAYAVEHRLRLLRARSRVHKPGRMSMYASSRSFVR